MTCYGGVIFLGRFDTVFEIPLDPSQAQDDIREDCPKNHIPIPFPKPIMNKVCTHTEQSTVSQHN
jgi:hypothetical protein